MTAKEKNMIIGAANRFISQPEEEMELNGQIEKVKKITVDDFNILRPFLFARFKAQYFIGCVELQSEYSLDTQVWTCGTECYVSMLDDLALKGFGIFVQEAIFDTQRVAFKRFYEEIEE